MLFFIFTFQHDCNCRHFLDNIVLFPFPFRSHSPFRSHICSIFTTLCGNSSIEFKNYISLASSHRDIQSIDVQLTIVHPLWDGTWPPYITASSSCTTYIHFTSRKWIIQAKMRYSTRHMEMDSESRVSLEANLVRNA